MKKFLFAVLFLIIGTAAVAQTQAITLRSYDISFSYLNTETQKFTEWSNEEPADVLIVLNKSSVDVYCSDMQKYNVISITDKTEETDGYSFIMYCVDKNGIRANMLIQYKSGTNTYSIFIVYKDVMIRYNCNLV